MISEAVVLRRELHEVLAKLEDSRNVNECILAALKSTRLEAAESKVGWDKSEEENAGLRRENAELKALLKQGGASDSEIQYRQRCVQLQEKCAKLEGELAGAHARHKCVSNAHTPPSKDSDAQHKLAKYRKRNKANYQSEKEERKKSTRNGGPRKEPLPVTESVDLTVEKCPECDVDADVKTETKDVVDIPDVPKAEKKQYRTSKGKCENGHKIDTTPKGLTRGSAFGPNLMTQIVFLFFTTLSLSSIAKTLQTYGLESVSKTTVLTALVAVATQKFAAEADRISKRLGDSKFLMADETPIRIGKKRGYVWVFIGEYGIKFTVAGSRGGPVLDLHCPHFHIPIVVDGYAAYNVFKVRQRCWAHVLRDAELLAAMHGGSLEELHQRLQSIFHSAKSLPRDISDEDLQKWIDNVSHIAGIYAELGYKFGGKLLGAAPDLFTFVRHPGMEPTNNRCERALRLVTLHKKIRLMFRSARGMAMYGTLMTCMTTWDDQGANLMEKIREAIMAS